MFKHLNSSRKNMATTGTIETIRTIKTKTEVEAAATAGRTGTDVLATVKIEGKMPKNLI